MVGVRRGIERLIGSRMHSLQTLYSKLPVLIIQVLKTMLSLATNIPWFQNDMQEQLIFKVNCQPC